MLEELGFHKSAEQNPNILLRPGEAIGTKLFKYFSKGNMKNNARNMQKFHNVGHGIVGAGVLGAGAVGGMALK